jgi:hypothetical protein
VDVGTPHRVPLARPKGLAQTLDLGSDLEHALGGGNGRLAGDGLTLHRRRAGLDDERAAGLAGITVGPIREQRALLAAEVLVRRQPLHIKGKHTQFAPQSCLTILVLGITLPAERMLRRAGAVLWNPGRPRVTQVPSWFPLGAGRKRGGGHRRHPVLCGWGTAAEAIFLLEYRCWDSSLECVPGLPGSEGVSA